MERMTNDTPYWQERSRAHDTISRQAAIEKFEPWLKVDGYSEGELNMLKAVLYELRFLPSAQPEQQWIPASERLPKVREWVLCQCREGIMDVLRLTEDGDWNKIYPHVEYMSGFVIAWMPLPVPYREDGEADGDG